MGDNLTDDEVDVDYNNANQNYDANDENDDNDDIK